MILPLLAFLGAFAAFGVSLFSPLSEMLPLMNHILLTLGALFLLAAVRLTSRLFTDYAVYLDGDLFCVDIVRMGRRRAECRIPLSALQRLLPYSAWKREKRTPAAFYRYTNRIRPHRLFVLTFDDGGEEPALLIEPSSSLMEELERILRQREGI